jgi:2-alkenal reductase
MTGEDHSVKDRPQFEADDTTTSYSPPRTDRPRWVDQGWGNPGTTSGAAHAGRLAGAGDATSNARPQHWFDPTSSSGPPAHVGQPSASPKRSGGGSRPSRGALVAGAAALAFVSAGLASGGTYGLLAMGGYLDRGTGGAGDPGTSAKSTPMQQVVRIEQSDLTRAVAAVSPAVVSISSGTTSSGDPLEAPATGVGSGVIYDPAGWILTNRRVVCGVETPIIRLADGRQFVGRTYGVDVLTDLAIVRIDGTTLAAATIGDSAALKPGQQSMAIGNTLDTLTTSVTSGVVSALGRDVVVADACGSGQPRSLRNLIQTDAAINAGNSGGALVNSSGDVIGIATSIASGVSGIGYAIPINIAKPIMQQAIDGKMLTRPWVGITFVPLNAGIAQQQGLPIDHGVLVQGAAEGTLPGVVPDSPAAAAGLREGDIITAIDDQRIDSTHPLDDILAQYKPAGQDPLAISVLRGGTPIELTLYLGTRNADQLP